MKKIAIIVLTATALGFSAAPSYAWSNFVKELASKTCSHLNSNGKNGCYAYIEPRVQKGANPSGALQWCKETRCASWFSSNGTSRSQCEAACTYLYNMGN